LKPSNATRFITHYASTQRHEPSLVLPKRWNAAPRWAITLRPWPRAITWISCFRLSLSQRRIHRSHPGQRPPQDERIQARFPIGSNSSERLYWPGWAGGFSGPKRSRNSRPSGSRFDLTPNQWDFGRSQVGARGQAQSFRFTNQGEEPFSRVSVRIAENILGSLLGRIISKGATYQGVYNFKIEDNRCKVTLNPGEKCEIVVRFMPSSAGNRRGTLQVSVDDRLATASLSGEGVGAQPQPRRVWRCVNGKIEYLDARECQRREGNHTPTRRRPGADAAPSGDRCVSRRAGWWCMLGQ
jgi:hypothetical protein